MSSVPERLPVYFGVDKGLLSQASTLVPPPGIKAGLLVVNDTTLPRFRTPASPIRGIEVFTQRLEAALKRTVSCFDRKSDSLHRLETRSEFSTVYQYCQKRKISTMSCLRCYQVLKLKYQIGCPFQGDQFGGGGGRGRLLGFRAENYALVELALVDGKTGHPIVHANGSAWSVLERLNVPIESNVYPVVRRDLTQPPIYPSSETAYETLRVVSADDAMKQALMHLEEVWSQQTSS